MSGKVVSGNGSGQRYLTMGEELVTSILEMAKIGLPQGKFCH